MHSLFITVDYLERFSWFTYLRFFASSNRLVSGSLKALRLFCIRLIWSLITRLFCCCLFVFVPDEGLLIVVGEWVTLPPHGKWDGSLPFWLDGKGEGGDGEGKERSMSIGKQTKYQKLEFDWNILSVLVC